MTVSAKRLVKRADVLGSPPAPPAPPVPTTPTTTTPVVTAPLLPPHVRAAQAEADALRTVGRYGLYGMGAGASLAGIAALVDYISHRPLRPAKDKRHSTTIPTVLEIPTKSAQTASVQGLPANRYPSGQKLNAYDVINNPSLVTRLPGSQQPQYSSDGILDWFRGLWTDKAMAKPWFLPAVVGLGVAGGVGGYKGVGALNEWYKKHRREKELNQAKDDYRSALMEQYDTPKQASDSCLADQLDALAEEAVQADPLAKQATWEELGGGAIGAYLALAGLIGTPAGLATYHYTKANNQSTSQLQEALKQRERLRWAARPPEIYAVARPQVAPTMPAGLEDDEDEIDDKKKKQKIIGPSPMPAPMPKIAFAMATIYRRAIGAD